jgi:acyl carrier protein
MQGDIMAMPEIFGRRPALSLADEVLTRLRRRVPHIFAGARRDTPLSDLPLDSLDVVELLCATEDEFGVRLTAASYAKAQSVGDLTDAIARRWTPASTVSR